MTTGYTLAAISIGFLIILMVVVIVVSVTQIVKLNREIRDCENAAKDTDNYIERLR